MGITMIVGRQSQRLSEEVYRQIGAALDAGKEKLYLVVPEQFTLGAEEALIKANRLSGLLDVEVLSPKRLENRVLQETGGLTKTYMDSHGKNMLLQKTLGDIQEQLTIYRSSVKKPGFLLNIADLIGELKQNEISPENLEETRKRLNQGIMPQKLGDVIKIYRHFQELLGNDRKDEEDLRNFVCGKIPTAEFLKDSEIWIDGFQNFSAQDYRMIGNLLETATEIHIALPWDPNPVARDLEVFHLTATTMDAIKAIGARAQVSFKVEKISSVHQKKPELAHLEANLFAYPKLKYLEAVHQISLIQCQNTWEEVEMGAHTILELIREEGLSFRDIVVLAGDLDEYGSIIKRIFAQYQIPFFMDDLRAIGDNHLVEAVVTALEAIQSNYRLDDVIGFVKTGFSPISLSECEDLENYALEFGIRGKQWEQEFSKISQNSALELVSLNALRVKLITPLAQLKAALKAGQTCQDYTRTLYEFLVTIKTPEKIEALVEQLLQEQNYEAMEIYHQIWNILMEVFDQIVETMGSDEVTGEEYLRILKSGFQGYQLGIIPPYRDYVSITDLRRSRSSAFEVLIVFGLNEGKIPGAGSEPNLFSDLERQILGANQIWLQNNRSFQMDQERFLVYDLLTKPQSRLVLHWALADLEGNSQQPSILVSQILGIFPTIEIISTLTDGVAAFWNSLSTPDATLWHLVNYLRKSQTESSATQQERVMWAEVLDWYQNNPAYRKNIDNMMQALNYAGVSQAMTGTEAAALYGKNLRTSITRLETHRQCPFSHYVRYGLKPEGRPIYTIAAPEIGTLLHELIDGFFRAVREQQLDLRTLPKIKRDILLEEVLESCLPQIKTNVFNSTGQNQYLGKKLERVGKKSIDILVQQLCAGDFEPQATEFCFEQELSLPDAKLGEVKIYGKIDRLDLYQKDGHTWVKVIDYKTGSKKLGYDDIYYGLSLQLLVYLDGAMTVIPAEEILPGGTFYFYVDDPMPRLDFGENVQAAINKSFKLNGLLLDDDLVIAAMDHDADAKTSDILPVYRSEFKLKQDEFTDIIDYVRKTVIRQIKNIYQGDIKIRPYKKGADYACQYCDYKGICQFDEAISQGGYEVLKSAMKKEQFFTLIREGEGNEVDQ
ncbi:PD-(D/E)XK nuclease family protein [Acetobacterium wieringae]|uniref:PD-(D/E)XK nuclease family protein n=1 Tax=Acetobacterium wieringae TaxID=52694 RepID=UPI002B1EE9F4|nr:PD-(D/E)XK nuclease family protein [Acetobacterium wieringae]MEA4804453.1 PD-(D/E)XK nuclease family protein [Acetobacterium wieringae]